jgi:excisionase family DNA binding protein
MITETEAPLGAMSIDEFAENFRISRVTLYKQAKAGRLRLTKVGTRTIVLLRDVIAWEQGLQTKSKGGANAA